MSRKFLIVDRPLVGTSLKNRKRKWQLSDNEHRGHPMVSRRGDSAGDYLRKTSARYYSWEKGTYPNTYKDFAYLQQGPLENQGSVPDSVGFNVSSFEEFFPPDFDVHIDEYDDELVSFSKYVLGDVTRPPAASADWWSKIRQKTILELSGAAGNWAGAPDSVPEAFRELFNAPSWTNWQAYVLGGDAVTVDDDDTPDRKFYGIFGDSGGSLYTDHQFEKPLPSESEVSVVTNYNYYNAFFDGMINISDISELYIPNLYSVYSIAGNGEDYLYENLYDGDSASRSKIGEMLSSVIAPADDDDFLNNSKIPIGQIQISSQTPGSVLSRFARKDFTEDMGSARKRNRHLGISPELLESPDSLLTDINGRQQTFPYSADITFPAAGTAELFSDAHTEDALKFFLFETMKANILGFSTGSYNFYEKIEFSARETIDEKFKYYGFDWTGPGSWEPQDNPEARQPYAVNAIDLHKLFENIFTQHGSSYGTSGSYNGFINQLAKDSAALVDGFGTIIGQKFSPEPVDGWDDGDYNIFESPGAYVWDFLLGLGEKLNDEVRSYNQALDGEGAYNKTLVYKLDKHRVDPSTNQALPEPVQSIYFPNVEGVISYHDTQVKFGQRYIYKAYSYDLVVGNQYKYENVEVYPPLANKYKSRLATLLGFDDNNNINVSPHPNQSQPYSGKEIFIGEPISIDTPPGPSILGVYWKRVTRPTDGSWYSPNVPFYLDYQIDGGNIRTRELNIPLSAASVSPDEGWSGYINLTNVATQVEAALGPGWRVRFLPSSSRNISGRFVVGRVSDLQSLEIPEMSALLPTEQMMTMEMFDGLFNLSPLQQGDLDLDLTFLFKTGPHGSSPEYPWDLGRAGSAAVEAYNYKSLKILELPYFETQVFEIVDLPPQFPDVEIFPLKGESSRIKILLNENSTRGSYQPVTIEPEDEAKYEQIRIGQGRGPADPIVFGSDDSIVSFQVYRADTPPAAYVDFAGKLRYTLSTFTPAGRSITTASKLDNIEPNVNYYYCFRTIDKNGFISVPSPILKVQMVDNNGRVYPIIESYDLPRFETRSSERSFRRYLEIDTSLESKQITDEDSEELSAGNPLQPPEVGLKGTIWGDDITLKVRVISKDTGRKIDLNLNFNAEAIPNPNLQGD